MFRIIVPLFLVSTISAHAEEQTDWSGSYYCKITASGGLKLNRTNNEWESTRFDVQDEAILVTARATGQIDTTYFGPVPTYTIKVKKFGDESDGIPCTDVSKTLGQQSLVPVHSDGSTACGSYTSEYQINFKSKRILVMYPGGYMDEFGTNTDTPNISVGKCDKVG